MTNAEKQLKEMEEQMRREQASQKQEKQGRSAKPYAVKKESHPLASFLIGLVLLGAGIYWVLNSFVVSFSWGSLWGGFGMNTSLATGLMLVPLLIGIGLLFFLDRKWIGWVVVAIGLLAILVTLLTSVRFRPITASLWQYVVMFGIENFVKFFLSAEVFCLNLSEPTPALNRRLSIKYDTTLMLASFS